MDGSAARVTRSQALAFRLTRHHLSERLGPDGARAAAVVGLQDTPPGTAALSLAARADVAPRALGELVLVPSVRGAPLAVAVEDLALFTAGLEPPDEEAAKVLVGNAWRSLDAISALDALDRVSDAVHDSLRGGPLVRDDFHQALRERLPRELLWWCKGCGSHHVHPSLWRATGIRGVLAIVGREGRSAVFGLPPAAPPIEDPGAELARRFLRAYGPARPKLLADWAGLATSHARALWERAGDVVAVDLDGKRAWVLAGDEPALALARRVPERGRATAREPRPAARRPRPRAARRRSGRAQADLEDAGGPGDGARRRRGRRPLAGREAGPQGRRSASRPSAS